jgi:hypothetical protein
MNGCDARTTRFQKVSSRAASAPDYSGRTKNLTRLEKLRPFLRPLRNGEHGRHDDDSATDQRMTGAAVGVADGIVASAGRSHPCGAGVMPAFSMWECEMPVPQSRAGERGDSTPATGLTGRRAAHRSLALFAQSRESEARKNKRTDAIRLIHQMFKMTQESGCQDLEAASQNFRSRPKEEPATATAFEE